MIISHIYAGARIKPTNDRDFKDFWLENHTERYFDLLHKYKGKLILEVSGHDHQQDLRAINHSFDD